MERWTDTGGTRTSRARHRLSSGSAHWHAWFDLRGEAKGGNFLGGRLASRKNTGAARRRYAEQLRDDAVRNLLLSVALIAAGLLAGYVHPENALVVVGLLVAVGTAVFCADWISRTRFLEFMERNATAHREEVRRALLRGSGNEHGAQVGSSPAFFQEDVLQLERAAHGHIWVYAYDLSWEKEEDSFTDVVRSNMSRGVRYRYLVPPGNRMLVRIRDIIRRYSDIDGVENLLEFRIRPDTNRLVQFGITIYDPEPTTDGQPVAVFFPHFSTAHDARWFPYMAGNSVIDVAEGFSELWMCSDTVDIGRLLND